MILNYFKPQMYWKHIVVMRWSVSFRISVSCCSSAEIYATVENLASQKRPALPFETAETPRQTGFAASGWTLPAPHCALSLLICLLPFPRRFSDSLSLTTVSYIVKVN
jgi:hypothetical protein